MNQAALEGAALTGEALFRELATWLQIERPLISLDLETTGTDPDEDRIVQIGMLRATPGDPIVIQAFTSYVNPGVPIPPESTAHHQVTDAQVANAPRWAALMPDFLETVAGSDFLGFRIAKFDLPLLSAECLRNGRSWYCPLDARRLDGIQIFFKKEPRDLTAAVARYGGREHPDAHDAGADALASVIVLHGQLQAYPDLPRSVQALSDYCFPDPRIDAPGKIVWRGQDAVFNFGKWDGVPLQRVPKEYLEWMLKPKAGFPEETKQVVRRCLGGSYPVREAPCG